MAESQRLVSSAPAVAPRRPIGIFDSGVGGLSVAREVLATSGTLRAARFARLLLAHGGAVEVIAQACPGLADLIEEGHLDDDVLATRLDALTRPLKKAGVDTVVLGCTHYPFVSAAL